MKHRSNRVLLAGAAALLYACAPERSDHKASAESEPAATPATARLVPDLWIGRIGLNENAPDVFGELFAVQADPRGNIYALDRLDHEVRVFDKNGQHVRSIGRRGSGPGEFREPNGIRIDPVGRLWVSDVGNNRLLLFDQDGVFLRTYSGLTTSYTLQFDGEFSNEALVVTAFVAGPARQQGLHFLRFDPRIETVDTFPFPTDPTMSAPPPWIVERGRRVLMVPFIGGGGWRAASDDQVWIGNGQSYRFHLIDLRGDTIRTFTKETERTPVTSADVEWVLDQGWYKLFRHELDVSNIPPQKPAFHKFWVDELDRLWVLTSPDRGWERPELLRSRREQFDVFDGDGIYLRTVELGPVPDDVTSIVPPSLVREISTLLSADGVATLPADAFARPDVKFEIQAIVGDQLYAILRTSVMSGILRYRLR
jgi:hypothetical protein